jgi:parvulin-like peptidyl-prolyl isomerase
MTRTKEEAKALAEKIFTEATAADADFAELAQKHSESPDKVDGGDLGRIQLEDIVLPISEAAFALEVGKISKPVETEFGFHVIKRTE